MGRQSIEINRRRKRSTSITVQTFAVVNPHSLQAARTLASYGNGAEIDLGRFTATGDLGVKVAVTALYRSDAVTRIVDLAPVGPGSGSLDRLDAGGTPSKLQGTRGNSE